MSDIHARLNKFISANKITPQEFERKVGVSDGYVRRTANAISPATIKKIHEAYPALNTNWLKTGEGVMANYSITGRRPGKQRVRISQASKKDIELAVNAVAENRAKPKPKTNVDIKRDDPGGEANVDPDIEIVHRYIDECHSSLNAAISANEKEYNKSIFYISTGTIVLSVTFLGNIIDLSTCIYVSLLIAAWSFLLYSIGLNIYSYLKIAKESRLGQEKLSGIKEDKNKEPKDKADESESVIKDVFKSSDKYNKKTAWAFFIGLALLTLFIVINIINYKIMPQEKKKTDASEIMGIVKKETQTKLNESLTGEYPVKPVLSNDVVKEIPGSINKPKK